MIDKPWEDRNLLGSWDDFVKEHNKKILGNTNNMLEKRKKAGLRKCPGHKFPKIPSYDENNQCSICKGYKKES